MTEIHIDLNFRCFEFLPKAVEAQPSAWEKSLREEGEGRRVEK